MGRNAVSTPENSPSAIEQRRSRAAARIPHGRTISAGHRLVIDEPQSVVVWRIFEQFARGEGLRSVARRFNAEGVHPLRPRSMAGRGRASWSASALQALLQNPLYRGELIWNRSEWIKDHATGKRRRFERPESEWIRREVPDLAIVSRDCESAFRR